MRQNCSYISISILFSCLISCSKNTFQNSEKTSITNSDEAITNDITLKVNSSEKDVYIQEGENIEVIWDGGLSENCSLMIGDEDVSKDLSGQILYQNIVQDTGIKLRCDQSSQSVQVIVNNDNDDDLETKKTNIFFKGYTTRQIDGEKIKDPVTMHFVIDVTNSMNDVLDVIVAQIGDFSKKLEKNNINIHLNLTVFRDIVESSISFEDNINGFRKTLIDYVAQGGGDIPEASLKALEEATQYIADNENRDNAIRTIVLITDSWGHDTSNFEYDCDLNSTAEFMKTYFIQQPEQWKFFYSSRNEKDLERDENLVSILDPNLLSCQDNWPSPSQQYEELLKSLEPQALNKDHKLPWPFTKKSLLDKLYTHISETVADQKISCMTSEVEIRKSNHVIKTWSPNIKDVWKNRGTDLDIQVNQEGTQNDFQIFAKHCCLPTKKAKEGDFDLCKEDKKFEEIKIEKASAQ